MLPAENLLSDLRGLRQEPEQNFNGSVTVTGRIFHYASITPVVNRKVALSSDVCMKRDVWSLL